MKERASVVNPRLTLCFQQRRVGGHLADDDALYTLPKFSPARPINSILVKTERVAGGDFHVHGTACDGVGLLKGASTLAASAPQRTAGWRENGRK